MRLNYLFFIVLVLLASCVTESSNGGTVYADIVSGNGRVINSNENFTVDCDLEYLGYSPVTGKFYPKCTITSHKKDVYVDIAFISDAPLRTGSTVKVVRYNIPKKIIKSYTCSGNKYGWITVGELAYCNTTYIDGNLSEYDIEKRISVTDENYFHIPTKTLYWNVSTIVTDTVLPHVSKATKNTPYGNRQYYFGGTLKKGIRYDVEFEILLNKKYLPLKYTITIGNIAQKKLYFVLDPTIINSRTWTTQVDMENGTTLDNLTADGGTLRLVSLEDDLDVGIAYYVTLDESGTVTESVGNLTDFDKVNTPTFISSAVVNGGYQFTGGDTDCLNNSIERNYNGGNYTISFWANVTSHNLDSGYFHTGYPSNRVGLITDPFAGSVAGTEMGYVDSFGNGISQADVCMFSSTPLNEWHMYSATWNGSHQKVYLDGVLENTCAHIGQTADGFSNNFEIGSQYNCGAYSADGSIDELGIWTIELTASQLINLRDQTNISQNQYPFSLGIRPQGFLSDLQNWTSTENFTNISIVVELQPSIGNISFRFNETNSSLDGSVWSTLSDGTNVIQLNEISEIYYRYRFLDNTGNITSWTITESNISVADGDTCDTNNWDCAEECTVDGLDAGGDIIIASGQGIIFVTEPVTNCFEGNRTLYVRDNCGVIIKSSFCED